MRETVRHAVFIEPEGDLRDLVIRWKERVASLWPAARYLHHPPHSTVWVGELVDGEAAGRELEKVASKMRGTRVSVKSACVFYDDALAEGGQTCAFGAALTDGLADFQQVLCQSLRAHRKEMSDDSLAAPLRREPYFHSWRQYGFPFVGPHWAPHFTVASLPVRRDDPVIGEFLASKPPEATRFCLSWWRVIGEQHERLAELRLAASESS